MRILTVILITSLLPLAADAQVLDTLETTSDSTDYQIETYFVETDTASFFEPHSDERAVRALINRTGRGRCRVVTVVRAVDQRRAAQLADRYDGGVINTRLIVRCAPPSSLRPSAPTLSSTRGRGKPLLPHLRIVYPEGGGADPQSLTSPTGR